MFKQEVVFLLCAVVGYAGAFILLLFGVFFADKNKISASPAFYSRCPFLLIVFGAMLHCISLLLRWLRLGFFPFIDVYTSVSGCALTGILIFLFFVYKQTPNPEPRTPNPELVLWALCLLPSSFLLMGFGLMSGPEIKTLAPALQTIWLYIHVTFAILAQGSYFIAATLGILYFIQRRKPLSVNPEPRIPNPESRTPNPEPRTPNPELLIYRFIAIGFVLHAVMVISGAIWAQNAWGRYWGWDAIEIWSLITWFIYGIFLHLRITYKWQGSKVAFYSVCGFLLTIFCYYLVPHVYSVSLHVDTKF